MEAALELSDRQLRQVVFWLLGRDVIMARTIHGVEQLRPVGVGDTPPAKLAAEALELMRVCQADQLLVDEVVTLFLDTAESQGRMTGFPFLSYAYQVAQLGASLEVLERLMSGLASYAWIHQLETTADLIGRPVSAAEVDQVVNVYAQGAVSSRGRDEEIVVFAERWAGRSGRGRAKVALKEKDDRCRNDLF